MTDRTNQNQNCENFAVKEKVQPNPEEKEAVRLEYLNEIYDLLNNAKSLLFLDTEATGGTDARIIEAAVCEINADGKLTGGLCFRCNPHRRSTGVAKRVHGILDRELFHCHDFKHYAEALRKYLKGNILVIHDAKSDLGWLDAEYRRIDPSAAPLETECTVVDSLKLARAIYPQNKKFSLDALAAKFGLSRQSSNHDAYGDADLLSRVFFAMWWDLDSVLYQ